MPSTSGTRIIPAAGKRGILGIAGDNGEVFSLYGDDWDAQLEVENARVPHFDMEIDDYGLYWPAVLTGFASGTGRMSAKFSLDPSQGVNNALSLYIGEEGVGLVFLGFTDLVGLVCSYVMTQNNPLQGITQTAGGMYNFQFEITSARFTSVGP